MKSGFGLITLAIALLFTVVGCDKKSEVKSEISELEKSFKNVSAAAPAISPSSSTPAHPGDAQQWVDHALAAARADDYVGSVVALQSARTSKGATPEQLMAVQRTMQAMTSDLAARAARGDAKAKADLAAIEKTRSQ